MNINKNWGSTDTRTHQQSIKLGRASSCRASIDELGGESAGYCAHYIPTDHSRLKAFWRKIKREKKKLFTKRTVLQSPPPYDLDTYSRNFDEGSGCFEPENLSRSFSVRFARSRRGGFDDDQGEFLECEVRR